MKNIPLRKQIRLNGDEYRQGNTRGSGKIGKQSGQEKVNRRKMMGRDNKKTKEEFGLEGSIYTLAVA